MQVPFSKSTNQQLLPGHEVKDKIGRSWFFSCGFIPSMTTAAPEGEIVVMRDKNKPTKTNSFLTPFFPDIEFRDAPPVEKKLKTVKVEKAKRKVVTDANGRFKIEAVEG